ncbi:similar to Kazachstania africana KAFR_0G02830 hypothetical protein [Maudiozyma saulgeensis]|uniref:HMG box domain-containing protein n=1 Tax=Maudiozyma saulgeensis TaxID=1789683 RepID=A0A1X7R2S6_9SACH|nr:similar to Kazachstania africana KAFR_0G02830 hypothetical protein [Kazachstania saulgeensis]
MTSQANVTLPSIQMLLSNIEQKSDPPQSGPPPQMQPSYSYNTMYSTSGSAPIPVSTPVAINSSLYRDPYNAQYNVSYETPMPQYQPYMQVNGYISPVAGPQVTNMDSIRSAHILKSLSVQTQDVPRYQQPIMHMSARVQGYNQLPTPVLHKVSPVPYYEHNGSMILDGVPMEYSTEMTKIMPASPSSISSNSSSRTSSSSLTSTSASSSTIAGNQKSLKKCTCKKSSGSAEHIPRPRNAFILFRQHLHYSIFPKDRYMLVTQGSFKTNSEVSREIGKRWRQLPAEEKKYWQDLAQKEKEMHKQKYPDYKYAPRKLMDSQDSNSDSDDTSAHHGRQRRRQREPCAYCKLKKRSNN